jgi:hypothetical protein
MEHFWNRLRSIHAAKDGVLDLQLAATDVRGRVVINRSPQPHTVTKQDDLRFTYTTEPIITISRKEIVVLPMAGGLRTA